MHPTRSVIVLRDDRPTFVVTMKPRGAMILDKARIRTDRKPAENNETIVIAQTNRNGRAGLSIRHARLSLSLSLSLSASLRVRTYVSLRVIIVSFEIVSNKSRLSSSTADERSAKYNGCNFTRQQPDSD